MFYYDVLTEEQAMLERFQLLPEGDYDAVLIKSEDKTSSTGNHMMDLTLAVYDENGKEHNVRDFLVFTKPMMWKIVHFANSAGLLKEYEEQRLCSDVVINHRVKVKVGIDAGKEIPIDKLNGKSVGSKYFDKNKVEDYITKEYVNSSDETIKPEDPFFDDDISF